MMIRRFGIALVVVLLAGNAWAQAGNGVRITPPGPSSQPDPTTGPARNGGNPVVISSQSSPGGSASFLILQNGNCTIASPALTCTFAVVNANPATSMIAWNGYTSADSTNTNGDQNLRIELTNSTTVTCTRGQTASTGTLTCFGQIISFSAGVSVQHITCISLGVTTCDQSMTQIDLTRSVCLPMGAALSSPPTAQAGYAFSCTLTGTTTVHFASIATSGTYGAEVVTFQ